MSFLTRAIKKTGEALLGPTRWALLRHRWSKGGKGALYDKLTELILRHVALETGMFIDVGCHEGDILRIMMRENPGARFLAFEPIPSLFRQLARDFRQPNVKVFDLALSDARGSTTFNYVVTNPAYSGIRKRRYDREGERDQIIEVQTDTLDHVLEMEGNPEVAFIKIDVEGAEYLVLRGGEETIRRCKPVIVFEHGLGGSDSYGKGPRDIHDLLVERCGMKISLLPDYLLGRRALTKEAFSRQFLEGLNFYFVAHS
jgi:FkbM family methyltransferase